MLFCRLRTLHNVLRSIWKNIEIGLGMEELLEFYRLDMRRLVVWGCSRSCVIKRYIGFYLIRTLVCLQQLILSLCFVLRNSLGSFHVCTLQCPTVFIAKLGIGHLQLLSAIDSWNLSDYSPSLCWPRIVIVSLPGTLILCQLSRTVSSTSWIIREGNSPIYKHLLMYLRINPWSHVPFLRWRVQNFQDHVPQSCRRLRLLHRLVLIVFPKGSWLFSF